MKWTKVCKSIPGRLLKSEDVRQKVLTGGITSKENVKICFEKKPLQRRGVKSNLKGQSDVTIKYVGE